MEENEVERPLMSEEEFAKMLDDRREQFLKDILNGVLHLHYYDAVKRFRSVRRAIKRGHISVFGDIYPKRPFGNKRTKYNDLKRKIYESLGRQK